MRYNNKLSNNRPVFRNPRTHGNQQPTQNFFIPQSQTHQFNEMDNYETSFNYTTFTVMIIHNMTNIMPKNLSSLFILEATPSPSIPEYYQDSLSRFLSICRMFWLSSISSRCSSTNLNSELVKSSYSS